MEPEANVSAAANSSKYNQSLTESYNNRTEERFLIVKITQIIVSFFKDIWRQTDYYSDSKEHNRTIMIQENLLTHGDVRGSNNRVQIDIFSKHLSTQKDPAFEDLSQALAKLTTNAEITMTSILPWMNEDKRDVVINNLVAQCANLKDGESVWVDLATSDHSMKGRIVRRDEGKYLFQMSNTGAGIDEHPNWHKKDSEKVNLYQTVVQWEFDGPQQFTEEFL